MKYQGVFFDFDYTLGDSTIPIFVGFCRGFAAMGLPEPTVEQVRPTVGKTLYDAYTMLTGDADPEHRAEFFHQFQLAVGEIAVGPDAHVMEEKSVLLPGAVELLRDLHESGVKVALVSTKGAGTIRQIFDRNGVTHLCDLIVGGHDVKRHKPDPEGLLFAMEQLGVKPEEVLFCGDTVIDAAAARNAGVEFAAVLNGTTPAEAFADYDHVHIAPDLVELHSWLKSL